MGWLRENWLEALLTLLVMVVVVAIVFFLTGVNPFAKRGELEVTAEPPAYQAEVPAEPAAPEPEPQEEESAGAYEVSVLPMPPVLEEEPEPEPEPELETFGSGVAKSGEAEPPPSPAPPSPSEPLYRVAVGAFADPEQALRLAEALLAEGYPVRIEPVAGMSRVVVGPYRGRAEAERVAARLARYQPMVYRGDSPLPEGSYLQVGAFRRPERALELVRALKEEGYPVVVRMQGGWTRVWVGPLAPEDLPRFKERLLAQGYEVVEVEGGQR